MGEVNYYCYNIIQQQWKLFNQDTTYVFDLEGADDKVSVSDRVDAGHHDVGVLLGTSVGPVLSALHL